MKTCKILEGKAELIVPDFSFYRVPGDAPVFYNPVMSIGRDISVSLARAVNAKKVCDPLSGTGVRAIRYALEAGAEGIANDVNPEAFEIIQKNVSLNNLEGKVGAKRMDANELMSSMRKSFDLVDIDPFGSPIGFMESAIRSLKDDGIIALTATDTAPLSGTYPKKCMRRYFCRPLKTPYHEEVGVRLLAGVLARYAFSLDKVIEPLLSHATLHYYRIFARVRRGKKFSDVGYLHHCTGCGNRFWDANCDQEVCEVCKKKTQTAGPLWTGPLGNPTIIGKMEIEGNGKKIVDMCREEYALPQFYYNLHILGKINKTSNISFSALKERLESCGFRFSRTHFSPYGFRTDADFKTILGILRKS
jgi:tRNA (guanine26-N2/guanine27-N2)-dimethyltransferase